MQTDHVKATEESGHLRVGVLRNGQPHGPRPLFLRPGMEMSCCADRGLSFNVSPATEEEFLHQEAILEGRVLPS